MKDKVAAFLGLIAALLLGAAPASAAPAVPVRSAEAAPSATPAPVDPRLDVGTTPRPAIWLLSDADTRIYLFGTVHILPPELLWRSAELNRVVAEADELVLEIADEGEEGAQSELMPLMLLGKTVPIAHRVSPDRREALAEMVSAAGMEIGSLDSMQTWAVAVSIAATSIARDYAGDSGVPPEALTGVEDALRSDFRARNKPISGVETSAQQLGFFARMPLRTQRALLESMVDAYRAGDAGIMDPGEDGWVRGDTARIAAEMERMPPELFEPLLTRRNQAWTDWLVERLQRPGTVLFAVGAGHLAGRDSVQTMLAARGLTVQRVD